MSDSNNIDKDEYVNFDDLTQELIQCYQVQVDDNGKVQVMIIGIYPKIPTHVYDTFTYANGVLKSKTGDVISQTPVETSEDIDNIIEDDKEHKYIIHIVGYIISQEMVDNRVLPMIGLIVCNNDNNTSSDDDTMEPLCALDLMYDDETDKFQYVFSDKSSDASHVIKTFDTIDKKNIFNDLVTMIMQKPIVDFIDQ